MGFEPTISEGERPQTYALDRSATGTGNSNSSSSSNNNNNNIQAVHTDREVTANRPDIILKNKKEKTCTLIDVAIPADRNVVQKEAEKQLKYKSLCIEIQRMWNLKCMIVPVINTVFPLMNYFVGLFNGPLTL